MAIHPSDMHFIWAQGRLIVIKSIGNDKNTYLKGHDGRITVIQCSRRGNLLASGEVMGPGFQVAIIVWDFNSLEMLYRVRYHKEAIIALSFSFDEKYLLSLGCKNDGN
jgi:WD40 repeat protein